MGWLFFSGGLEYLCIDKYSFLASFFGNGQGTKLYRKKGDLVPQQMDSSMSESLLVLCVCYMYGVIANGSRQQKSKQNVTEEERKREIYVVDLDTYEIQIFQFLHETSVCLYM